ncbi:hypothetical protein ACFV16_02805 [Streptomyces massasporeus]|uniref:hypothetical protein n=1 Tax=Streptomyces massasporeus TaxID=67324 RepID=UPI00367DC8E5
MSRLLRYLIIWLACTAASVTAVILTIHFVVGSTRPTAPVAQSAPSKPLKPPRPSPTTAKPSPSPSASSRRPSPPPRSSEPATDPSPTPTPTPTPTGRTSTPTPTGAGGSGCQEGGAGVYTVPSEGGKATVRFGDDAVCLISAVPNQGFTVSTSRTQAQTLTVTFSASRHRSEITATVQPQSRADVREVSW